MAADDLCIDLVADLGRQAEERGVLLIIRDPVDHEFLVQD